MTHEQRNLQINTLDGQCETTAWVVGRFAVRPVMAGEIGSGYVVFHLASDSHVMPVFKGSLNPAGLSSFDEAIQFAVQLETRLPAKFLMPDEDGNRTPTGDAWEIYQTIVREVWSK